MTVNVRGQIVGPYNDGKSDVDVKEGDHLVLNLDAHLQAFAESLLAARHGALVAIDPQDGRARPGEQTGLRPLALQRVYPGHRFATP